MKTFVQNFATPEETEKYVQALNDGWAFGGFQSPGKLKKYLAGPSKDFQDPANDPAKGETVWHATLGKGDGRGLYLADRVRALSVEYFGPRAQTETVAVVCESGPVWLDDYDHAYLIVKHHAGPQYPQYARPCDPFGEIDSRWLMANGRFIYCCDGRFGELFDKNAHGMRWGHPISVHDRFEHKGGVDRA